MSAITIHKFRLNDRSARQSVEVVGFVRILDVQMQGDDMMLWCVVLEGGRETTRVALRVVPTGGVIPDEVVVWRDYVRTVQDGPLVWHIFAPPVRA